MYWLFQYKQSLNNNSYIHIKRAVMKNRKELCPWNAKVAWPINNREFPLCKIT